VLVRNSELDVVGIAASVRGCRIFARIAAHFRSLWSLALGTFLSGSGASYGNSRALTRRSWCATLRSSRLAIPQDVSPEGASTTLGCNDVGPQRRRHPICQPPPCSFVCPATCDSIEWHLPPFDPRNFPADAGCQMSLVSVGRYGKGEVKFGLGGRRRYHALNPLTGYSDSCHEAEAYVHGGAGRHCANDEGH